ncbi:MAG: glycosyltransferase, partial [Baekduiaceae bacterium]
ATLRAGAPAVQTAHVVANPEASPVAALRYAAFRLMMTIRPAGMASLGMSAGLYGTGMGFRRDVLRELGWRSFSITEDLEQHLRLVAQGHRVSFLPHSTVASPAPLTHEDAESQQVRWEGGRFRLATRTAPAFAWRGLRRRDPVLVLAALDLTVPPQSLHAAGNVVLLLASTLLGARRLRTVALLSTAGQMGYVAGGLVATRAPASVWRALLEAPVLVARKLGVFGRVAAGGTPQEFVRTHRDEVDPRAEPEIARKPPAGTGVSSS